jgi:hypothetical protein
MRPRPAASTGTKLRAPQLSRHMVRRSFLVKRCAAAFSSRRAPPQPSRAERPIGTTRLVTGTCAALARPRTAHGLGWSLRSCSYAASSVSAHPGRIARRQPHAGRPGVMALAAWGAGAQQAAHGPGPGVPGAHPVRAAASSKRCASRAARWNASARGAASGASGAAAAAAGPASRRSMYAAARRGQASAPSAANVACPPPHTASARAVRARDQSVAVPPASRTA